MNEKAKNRAEYNINELVRQGEEKIEELKEEIASISKEKEAYLDFVSDEGERIETNEFYDGCLPDWEEFKNKHFTHCREVKVKVFDGFKFKTIFQNLIVTKSKGSVLFVSEGDDGGIVCTPWGDCYHVGEYPTCYFFRKKPTKAVKFEESIYFF